MRCKVTTEIFSFFAVTFLALSVIASSVNAKDGDCLQYGLCIGGSDVQTQIGDIDKSSIRCGSDPQSACSCTIVFYQCGDNGCYYPNSGQDCGGGSDPLTPYLPKDCNPNNPVCLSNDNSRVTQVIGPIPLPSFIASFGYGVFGLHNFLDRLIVLIYSIAGVILIFMLITGAFQWIISGGEKEALSRARGRITHAIIGLIILALTFVLINFLSSILGLQIAGGPT